MLKAVAALMVVLCTSWLGLSLSAEMKRRVDLIGRFIAVLDFIEGEIAYSLDPLPAIFQKIAGMEGKGTLFEFFRFCANRMEKNEGEPLSLIWDEAVDRHMSAVPFFRQEAELIRSLGMVLGKNDIDGQKKVIGGAKAALLKLRETASEEYRRYSPLARNLGVLSGVTILILIL